MSTERHQEPSAAAIEAAYVVSERRDGETRTEPLIRALHAAYAIDGVALRGAPQEDTKVSAWMLPPKLSDEVLGAIEAAIIEASGDGETAAYVVRYLTQQAAGRGPK